MNVQTRVVSRSAGSTYVVADRSSGKTMTREDVRAIWRGCRTSTSATRRSSSSTATSATTRASERRRASRSRRRTRTSPGCSRSCTSRARTATSRRSTSSTRRTSPAPGYPDDRVIAVDLENGITRVLNSDYFGESKKGGLRMWNNKVYDLGGLALHAGLKVIPTDAGEKIVHDHRPVGDRQDHHDVHHAERLAPGPGRLRRAHARRTRPRHRERLLREDVQPRPGLRAQHLRRRREAERLPRERLPGRRTAR